MGLSDAPEDRLRAWLESSCAAQGVPVLVDDPGTLMRVAALLGGAASGPGSQARSARSRAAAARLQPPDGLHPVDVEPPDTGTGRADDGVVKDGRDDGVLPVQVEVRPLSA